MNLNRGNVCLTATALGVALWLPFDLEAEDWPQWRGPTRDGVWNQPGILESFPPEGLKISWRAPVGPGFSSPVVARGRVYVTDSQVSLPNARERVLCFEARTGRKLRTQSYEADYADWAFDPKNAFGPRPTPIVNRNRVFTLGARGCLNCLGARDGKVIWRRNLENKSKDSAFTPSPLIEGHLLLVNGVMFNLGSHKPGASVLWPETTPPSRRTMSDTSTALFQGDHLFACNLSGELVCIEARTGRILWGTNAVTDAKSGASMHIIANRESALVFNEKGELIRANLTMGGYHEKGRTALLSPTSPFGPRKMAWTPPAYADRQVLARSDEELVCASLAARKTP